MAPFLRKLLPYLLVATVLAIVYDGFVFGSRWYNHWSQAREGERQRKAKESDDARRTIEMLGGGQLKILSFYASPGKIAAGAKAKICYGVYGAQSLKLEPPVEDVYPAVERCFQVSPSKTTEYKLTAADSSGHTTAQQFVLQVAP